MGDKGRIYEKGWDGEYRPKEGLLSDPTAEVRRDLGGNPVPAKDWLGNEVKAADGTRLYEAQRPAVSDDAVGGLIGVVLLISLAVVAALAWVAYRLVGWWFVRFRASASRDLDEGRLSWTTIGWVAPVVGLGVVLVASTTGSGGRATPGLASGAGPALQMSAAAADPMAGAPDNAAATSRPVASTDGVGSASRDVGGLPDLAGYCVGMGFAGGARPGGDGWVCVAADGTTSRLDLSDACRAEYSRADLVAVAAVPGEAMSWRCWTSLTGAGPSATTSPRAAVETFMGQLDDAYRRGDTTWLLGRLHPAVIDAYGDTACTAAITDYQAADFASVVTAVTGPASWTYVAGKHSVSVADVYTVAVRRTRDGKTSVKTIHLALIDGQLAWFSNC